VIGSALVDKLDGAADVAAITERVNAFLGPIRAALDERER
jgi:tryptophan synthase alpha chain